LSISVRDRIHASSQQVYEIADEPWKDMISDSNINHPQLTIRKALLRIRFGRQKHSTIGVPQLIRSTHEAAQSVTQPTEIKSCCLTQFLHSYTLPFPDVQQSQHHHLAAQNLSSATKLSTIRDDRHRDRPLRRQTQPHRNGRFHTLRRHH
jgi:hypothetical protein